MYIILETFLTKIKTRKSAHQKVNLLFCNIIFTLEFFNTNIFIFFFVYTHTLTNPFSLFSTLFFLMNLNFFFLKIDFIQYSFKLNFMNNSYGNIVHCRKKKKKKKSFADNQSYFLMQQH